MATIGPFSPSQGLNTTASDFYIPKNQAVDLYNAFPRYGSVVNRGSLTKLNSSALSGNRTIVGIGSYFDPAQVNVNDRSPLIVCVAGDGSTAKKIYTGVYNSGAITFTDKTGSVTLGSSIVQNRWQFSSLNGIFVGVGNSFSSDPPFQITAYNGSASILPGSPPFASCICVVNNFMFLSGNYSSSSALSTIYWSAVGDPTTWPVGNNLTVRNNDGDYISALSSIGQDLVIFKTKSISILSTTTVSTSGTVTLGPLSTVSDSIGCLCPDAVKKLPDGRIIFFDNIGKLQIFDGSSITDVTNQIYPNPNVYYSGSATQFSSVSLNGTAWNPQLTQLLTMAVSPATTQVQIGASTQLTVYAYNYIENTWSFLSHGNSESFSVLAWIPASQGNASSGILVGGTTDGFLWSTEGSGDPNFIDSNGQIPTVKMSIQLPEGFVPRTLMIPATLESGASLTVTVGFNGTMNGSSSTKISSTNNPLWNLFDIRQNVNSMGRPMTMQIQIQPTIVKTFEIMPFYISDEILSNVS